jgi:hypothetical protein
MYRQYRLRTRIAKQQNCGILPRICDFSQLSVRKKERKPLAVQKLAFVGTSPAPSRAIRFWNEDQKLGIEDEKKYGE